MPIHPTPLPANLPTLLSSLRSPIFLTNHNPTHLRLGTKYLRRPLAGLRILSHYPPKLPSIATLNKKFANITGFNLDPKKIDLYNPQDAQRWVSPALKLEENVSKGWTEVERKVEAQGGMFINKREVARAAKVVRRRRIGRGAPKKSEGKKAQMSKKKR